MDERPPHYFDEVPAVASSPRTVELALPDVTLRLQTDRGVFGHGVVDAATKLLLLEGPPPPRHGDLLDLGCGTGAIALTLARRAPGATIWATDVNRRALQLCRANAVANGCANVEVVRPDELPAEVRFEAIWSNPPIRIGKAALHDLLERWLVRLAPTGSAHLVVSKHLGADSLQAWLSERGHHTRRYASRRGFRLLEVGPRSD